MKLPKNLYRDSRGRENHWRYKRPDGTFKNFKATPEQAIALAQKANSLGAPLRAKKAEPVSALPLWIEKFIEYRQEIDPRLVGKQSWKNRCAALRQLGVVFGNSPLYELTLPMIRDWWDTLSGHSQLARRPEYNKLFNYLMTQDVVKLPGNPFTHADDRPRVLNKPAPSKKRKRLTLDDYQKIHAQAPDWLQLAMDISLYTTMRRGDICELRFDQHIKDGHLLKTINKAQARGRTVCLRWQLNEHPQLKSLIDQARRRALQLHACPYIIARQPARNRPGDYREHYAQTLPDNITKFFAAAAKAAGVRNTGFHEIRSLAAHLYGQTNQLADVKELMAHTDEAMTAYYQSGHGLDYRDIHIRP